MLRLVTFNAWSVGNRDLRDNLLDLAEDAERPEVIACQEMKRYRGGLRGYVRVALDEGHPENANCVLFVRRNVELLRVGFLRVDGPAWVGPKHGTKHPPRVFPWVIVEHEDVRFEVMDVHRTPGGPYPHIKVNGESWKAEHNDLLAWGTRREAKQPGRPRIIIGDQNNRKLDLRQRSISDLAARLDGTLAMRGIDGAIGVNAKIRARKMPDLYGSDGHHPVIVNVRPKEM